MSKKERAARIKATKKAVNGPKKRKEPKIAIDTESASAAPSVFSSPQASVRCSACGGVLVFSAKTLGTAADSVCLVEIKPCTGCIDVIRAMM